MPSDWYAYKAPAGSYGQAGAMQRMGRFQGHIEGDSGTLQVLDVKGQLTMGEQGVLAGGQEAYDDGSGFWLEYNGGTPRFSLGDSTSSKLTWDGSGLNIVGGATLDSGNIGGWDINAASLSQGTGSTTVGLATSGGYAFYAGSATPSSAPFRVTPAGALTATSGSIAGWTMGSTSLSQGSGASTVGLATSGGYALYAGSATASAAPFRVTPAGALVASSATITGAITATSGSIGDLSITGTLTTTGSGRLAFGTSGADYLDENIMHFEVSSSETGKIEFKNGANTPSADISAKASSSLGNIYVHGKYSSSIYGELGSYGTSTSGAGYIRGQHATYGETVVSAIAKSASLIDMAVAGNTALQIEATNLRARFGGYIYPGTGSAQQTTNYIYAPSNELAVKLGDAAGTNSFRVYDSAGQLQFAVTSNGGFAVTDADATALGSYSGRIPIYVGGNLRYLGYYNA